MTLRHCVGQMPHRTILFPFRAIYFLLLRLKPIKNTDPLKKYATFYYAPQPIATATYAPQPIAIAIFASNERASAAHKKIFSPRICKFAAEHMQFARD